MADREASLKLKLDGSQAKKELESVGGVVGKLSTSFKSTIGTLSSGLTALTGLGAGIGFAHLVKGAIDTKTKVADMAFAIRLGSGEIVAQERIMRAANSASERWGFGLSKVVGAMSTLRDQTGSFAFASKNIETVGKVSRATGQDMQTLSNIAGDMQSKFGIEDVGEGLTNIASIANKGNVSLQEMSAYLGRVGASAKMAGIQGDEGLRRVLGFANFAKGLTGNMRQGMMAVQHIIGDTESGSFKERVTAKLGPTAGGAINPNMPFEAQLAAAIGAAGGDKAKLRKLFGSGPQLAVATGLTEVWEKGGKGAKGQNALIDALDEAGKSMVSFADVGHEAEERMKEPGARFEAALAGIERNVTQSPEVAKAIEKLSELVGPIATSVNTFIDFATKNPALGVGGAALGMAIMNTPFINIAAATIGLLYLDAKKLISEAHPGVVDYKGNPVNTMEPQLESPNILETLTDSPINEGQTFFSKRENGLLGKRWKYLDDNGREQYFEDRENSLIPGAKVNPDYLANKAAFERSRARWEAKLAKEKDDKAMSSQTSDFLAGKGNWNDVGEPPQTIGSLVSRGMRGLGGIGGMFPKAPGWSPAESMGSQGGFLPGTTGSLMTPVSFTQMARGGAGDAATAKGLADISATLQNVITVKVQGAIQISNPITLTPKPGANGIDGGGG